MRNNKKNINSEQLVQEDVEYNVLFNRDFTQMDEEINYSGMARSSDANGYIEPSDRMQFIISILHNVKNGQLNIYEYDPLTFDPDKLVKVHNIAWFEGIKSTDTAIFEDIATGEMKEVTVSLELKLQDVVGIRFFEDWYLDADNINMYKRVNGIVFLKEVIDAETGELKGVAPISPFYIQLNPGM